MFCSIMKKMSGLGRAISFLYNFKVGSKWVYRYINLDIANIKSYTVDVSSFVCQLLKCNILSFLNFHISSIKTYLGFKSK